MTRRERILIVDGVGTGPALRAALCEGGYDAVAATTPEGALALVPSFAPAAIVADATAPGCDGVTFLARLRELGSDAAVVAAVPRDGFAAAVAALRAGADAFLVRPLAADQLALALERALERWRLRRERTALEARLREGLALVGHAPALDSAREIVARVAPTRATVLLVGEAGTGKHHLAQVIHAASPRRDRPFVRVSCASASEALLEASLFGHEAGVFADDPGRRAGAFEQADGGTLYLEEVGRLPPALQVRVQRVLQGGELERVGAGAPVQVDVRVVAGTQRDLLDHVQDGRFRGDLYYRLDVVRIALPPLRARRDDLPELAAHFVARHVHPSDPPVDGLTPGALAALFAYDWPGNLRELENVVARALRRRRGRTLTLDDLSPVLHGARPSEGLPAGLIPGASLLEIEREAILGALERAGGSTTRAAELLGISVRKIQYRLKEYRLGTAGRRAAPDLACARAVVAGEDPEYIEAARSDAPGGPRWRAGLRSRPLPVPGQESKPRAPGDAMAIARRGR